MNFIIAPLIGFALSSLLASKINSQRKEKPVDHTEYDLTHAVAETINTASEPKALVPESLEVGAYSCGPGVAQKWADLPTYDTPFIWGRPDLHLTTVQRMHAVLVRSRFESRRELANRVHLANS